MGVNYIPEMSGYSGQQPFRFWCQTVLPIVYDDSLSYYELLNKVVNYLNNVITDVSSVENNVNGLYSAYLELQNYVNHYFDTLDVQKEVNKKMDEYAQNGTLAAIMAQFINPVQTFDTAEDMCRSTALAVGTYVRTGGRYNLRDGGGRLYIITDTNLIDNGGVEINDVLTKSVNPLAIKTDIGYYAMPIIDNYVTAFDIGLRKGITEQSNGIYADMAVSTKDLSLFDDDNCIAATNSRLLNRYLRNIPTFGFDKNVDSSGRKTSPMTIYFPEGTWAFRDPIIAMRPVTFLGTRMHNGGKQDVWSYSRNTPISRLLYVGGELTCGTLDANYLSRSRKNIFKSPNADTTVYRQYDENCGDKSSDDASAEAYVNHYLIYAGSEYVSIVGLEIESWEFFLWYNYYSDILGVSGKAWLDRPDNTGNGYSFCRTYAKQKGVGGVCYLSPKLYYEDDLHMQTASLALTGSNTVLFVYHGDTIADNELVGRTVMFGTNTDEYTVTANTYNTLTFSPALSSNVNSNADITIIDNPKLQLEYDSTNKVYNVKEDDSSNKLIPSNGKIENCSFAYFSTIACNLYKRGIVKSCHFSDNKIAVRLSGADEEIHDSFIQHGLNGVETYDHTITFDETFVDTMVGFGVVSKLKIGTTVVSETNGKKFTTYSDFSLTRELTGKINGTFDYCVLGAIGCYYNKNNLSIAGKIGHCGTYYDQNSTIVVNKNDFVNVTDFNKVSDSVENEREDTMCWDSENNVWSDSVSTGETLGEFKVRADLLYQIYAYYDNANIILAPTFSNYGTAEGSTYANNAISNFNKLLGSSAIAIYEPNQCIVTADIAPRYSNTSTYSPYWSTEAYPITLNTRSAPMYGILMGNAYALKCESITVNATHVDDQNKLLAEKMVTRIDNSIVRRVDEHNFSNSVSIYQYTSGSSSRYLTVKTDLNKGVIKRVYIEGNLSVTSGVTVTSPIVDLPVYSGEYRQVPLYSTAGVLVAVALVSFTNRTVAITGVTTFEGAILPVFNGF